MNGSLRERKVLVTAGPTHEPLDPVRYLGNRSSGKMGFALAAAAAKAGAHTILIAGPVALSTPAGVVRIDVTTAQEMEDAVHAHAGTADLILMAAAVADFRPRQVAPHKLKKEHGVPQLELVPNPDILTGLAEVAPAALRVGFAAETVESEAAARAKLEKKRADFLVVNDVSRSDIGFVVDDNEVKVYARTAVAQPAAAPIFFSRRPKTALAEDLVELFSQALNAHAPQLAS